MRRPAALWILIAAAAAAAAAQDADDAAHAAHAAHAADTADTADTAHAADAGHGEQEAQDAAAAPSGPVHAADRIYGADVMAAAREQLRREQGGFRMHTVRADRFELRAGDGDERYSWDLQGWYGGDIQKLWWKSEGAGELDGNADDANVQMLYSRAVTPYFDFQAGVRHDFEPSPSRSHAVLGVQGVLPYVFEIDAAAFISDEGDLTALFEAEFDMRIRQRLVLQPRVEMSFSAQAVPEIGIGPGLGSIEGGLRLRYELRREIAPYAGVAWERKTGSTADYARAAGDDPQSWQLVVGVRAWF